MSWLGWLTDSRCHTNKVVIQQASSQEQERESSSQPRPAYYNHCAAPLTTVLTEGLLSLGRFEVTLLKRQLITGRGTRPQIVLLSTRPETTSNNNSCSAVPSVSPSSQSSTLRTTVAPANAPYDVAFSERSLAGTSTLNQSHQTQANCWLISQITKAYMCATVRAYVQPRPQPKPVLTDFGLQPHSRTLPFLPF